jgi:PAS domain S-box-containing protein
MSGGASRVGARFLEGRAMDRHAVVIADPEGVIRFWSPGAEAAFGYGAAQAVGRTLDLIVPDEFRDAHWLGFRRAIASGSAGVEGMTSPFPVRRAGGEVAEVPGRLALVREPDGAVVAALVVFG